MMTKARKFVAALCAATVLTSGVAHAQSAADIVFVVDESGSMGGLQQFLGTFVPTLDTLLATGGASTRYGLVGYGAGDPTPRQVNVGGQQFGNAANFATATGTLVVSGGTEDGYDGIDFALQNYQFSTDPNATRLIVLVTDEDRDVFDANVTAQSIISQLNARNVFLGGILNQRIADGNGNVALGASNTQTYLDQNQDGVPEPSSAPVFGDAAGTTRTDYTDLIVGQPRGCVADLELQAQGGTNGQAFAAALADCIVQIIVGPGPVGTDPYIVYGTRDSLLYIAQNFSRQVAFRLTGRIGGLDRPDASDTTGSVVSAYGEVKQEVKTFNRVFGADLGPVETGTREFSVGPLKGFVTLSGEWADADYAGFQSYERENFSGIAGLDYEFWPGTILGVALGGHSSDADSATDSIDIGAFSLGVYGGTKLGSMGYIDGTLAYNWGNVDTRRATLGGFADGDTDSGTFTATVTPGVIFQAGQFTLNPSVEVGYANISVDAFNETGPGAQAFGEQDYDIYWAAPRFDVSMPLQQDWGQIVPTVGIGARFQGGDDNGSVLIGGIGGAGAPVLLPGLDDAAFLASGGVALVNTGGTMSARLDYDGTFGDDITSHQVSLRLRIAF